LSGPAPLGPAAPRHEAAPQGGAPLGQAAIAGEGQHVEPAVGDTAVDAAPPVGPEAALDVVSVIGE
jgi:hypothetical protein